MKWNIQICPKKKNIGVLIFKPLTLNVRNVYAIGLKATIPPDLTTKSSQRKKRNEIIEESKLTEKKRKKTKETKTI